ncbi:unnamed protein product [Microthlaspi erraticum]|uniref:RING-type domain-containing protein n=1 Tax=Microthlaspi erraticum TaxID=1685480 RepID=A0A6D2LJ88_9BRAS|nr:unnamed protein product [Microthlaspi erraticum]
MGALCCVVASRPLVTTKSLPPHSGSSIPPPSQDDPRQWRTNLSFSPAAYTRDDDQDMGDESHGFALCSSRQSMSLESCFQQSPRWASDGNEQKTWNVNSTPRSNITTHQCLNEEKGTAISQSLRSLLSLSESIAPWETPNEQPVSLTHCSYPRVFCNPVSEPHHTPKDSLTNPNASFMMSTTRNHQSSPVEAASSPNQSHRTTSSNEMLVDVERSNEAEVENPRSEPGTVTHQRCGVCKKLLSQRSPWCSYKILRCGDMPAAGVFPCHHVFHVECLDKVTPTAQERDPSCPVCSNTVGAMEQPLKAPETLELALRSLRRNRTAMRSETLSSTCNDNERRQISRSNKWRKLGCCMNIRLY